VFVFVVSTGEVGKELGGKVENNIHGETELSVVVLSLGLLVVVAVVFVVIAVHQPAVDFDDWL